MTRIKEQFNQGANDLKDEDRYLLEVYFETLWARRGSVKKYWLRALESARRAASLANPNEGH